MRNSLKEPRHTAGPQTEKRERERASGEKSEDLLWEKEIEDAISVAVRSVYRVA